MTGKKSRGMLSGSRSQGRVCLGVVVILSLLYFLRSFVLYVDLINPVGMEECHTGAVAREILTHGFQFPLEQYTPEYYENSILVGSLLTVVTGAALGINLLAVELVPFAFSFATLLIFIRLLIRGGYGSGAWFFIISYFFMSGTFVYLTMDSVGNHIIGLFMGAVILDRFYRGYTTGSPQYFYHMMFLAGLGLFIHLGSLLYTGLCVLVYVLYRPADGSRPRITAPVAARGALFFALGAVPFLAFLFKTRALSATYLFGVVNRRSAGVQDWGAYARAVAGQFLFQFDNRPWLLVFYLALTLLACFAWLRIRHERVPEQSRLLHFIICFFTAGTFAAVVVASGGEFTTYYTYLMPWLFMAGAALVSRIAKRFTRSPVPAGVAYAVLAAALMALLLPAGTLTRLNFSPGHALRKLTSNSNPAFCYWRFGRSFGNYVPFDGDSARYASKILRACGRLDTPEKQSECLWGWSTPESRQGFTLDDEAAGVLGPHASGLIARSIGGWSSSLLTCLDVDEAYVDDCLLGMVERNAVNLYSFKKPGDPFVRISCLPETPRFTGLVQEIRDKLRQGTLDQGPQPCPTHLAMLCIQADAYCAAMENRMDFCATAYETPDQAQLCRFIFEQVWMARDAGEANRFQWEYQSIEE